MFVMLSERFMDWASTSAFLREGRWLLELLAL